MAGADSPPRGSLPPGIDAEALARAEAAIERLAADYLTWVEADLVRLETCLAQVQADSAVGSARLEAIFRIAHDIKGQAATFGYPLLTEIALRLCRLIGTPPASDLGAVVLGRIAAHIAALAEVVARRMTGDGGAEGQDILHRLEG